MSWASRKSVKRLYKNPRTNWCSPDTGDIITTSPSTHSTCGFSKSYSRNASYVIGGRGSGLGLCDSFSRARGFIAHLGLGSFLSLVRRHAAPLRPGPQRRDPLGHGDRERREVLERRNDVFGGQFALRRE